MKKSKTRRAQISFYINGYVKTEVEIPADISNQKLKENLDSGDYLTSIIPGADVLNLITGFKKIGRVIELISSDSNYEDFIVKNLPLSKEEQEAEDYKTQRRVSD